MKAKEAPEKIYLTTDGNNSYVFTQKRSDNEGKYSFNHGVNVGQSKALSWVLEQLEAQNKHKSCTTDE